MCGIFAYLNKKIEYVKIKEGFDKIKDRGPDASYLLRFNNIYLGFHRLKINDMSVDANQPFSNNRLHLICNGEIYNFENLKKNMILKQFLNQIVKLLCIYIKNLEFIKLVNYLMEYLLLLFMMLNFNKYLLDEIHTV